jgi:anti-sigma regulatory factor (Ser/Thr protein kinase)
MLKSLSFSVSESNQVGEARRAANAIGISAGFDETQLGTLSIIVTELGTNLHKHAKQGELIIRRLETGDRKGIEILCIDRGPGMTEVAKCMEDGYSTTGTKGNGLGSVKRLSTVFDIYSAPQGTAVVSQLWNTISATQTCEVEIGAICLPYPGEHFCGDAWSYLSIGASHVIIIADGLGHGKDAAAAADQAIEIFDEQPALSPQLLLQRIHGALRSSRGAAVLILHLGTQDRKIVCSGIGNISSAIIKGDVSKSFVTLNGTIGHQAHRFQEFVYDWVPGSFLIFHSDGLQTKWKLDTYPGLQMRHASLVAAILYRDFRRERDDITVLAMREIVKSGAL